MRAENAVPKRKNLQQGIAGGFRRYHEVVFVSLKTRARQLESRCTVLLHGKITLVNNVFAAPRFFLAGNHRYQLVNANLTCRVHEKFTGATNPHHIRPMKNPGSFLPGFSQRLG
jgi:hypothetical protein